MYVIIHIRLFSIKICNLLIDFTLVHATYINKTELLGNIKIQVCLKYFCFIKFSFC